MVEAGKAIARVRKKNIQAEVKYRKIRKSYQQKTCFILSANLEVIYSKGRGKGVVSRWGLKAPSPKAPSCKVSITR